MNYVIQYEHNDTKGKIVLKIPDTNLPKEQYVVKLHHFIALLQEFNKHFKKNKIKTTRSIEE